MGHWQPKCSPIGHDRQRQFILTATFTKQKSSTHLLTTFTFQRIKTLRKTILHPPVSLYSVLVRAGVIMEAHSHTDHTCTYC